MKRPGVQDEEETGSLSRRRQEKTGAQLAPLFFSAMGLGGGVGFFWFSCSSRGHVFFVGREGDFFGHFLCMCGVWRDGSLVLCIPPAVWVFYTMGTPMGDGRLEFCHTIFRLGFFQKHPSFSLHVFH
jgi:hypothetical protein